ncbi:hypothetical protein FACS1894122_13600 [Alphaproteobacteria bacterium]|nr:hypothetical protein FACS1894122_13600 [Alphaproteobacteria bacterium]
MPFGGEAIDARPARTASVADTKNLTFIKLCITIHSICMKKSMELDEELEIEIYSTKEGKEPFTEWQGRLDKRLRFKVMARINCIQHGSFGDHKFLGDGVSELRFRDGIRIYYAEIGKTLVLLLCGGGKNTKRDQNTDIERAKRFFIDYKWRIK